MNTLLVLLKNELLFHFRSGIHYLYIGIAVLYSAILYFIPENLKPSIATAVILTDPAILGFMLTGAVLFFERDQGIPEILAITPISAELYIISKVISFSLYSLISSLIITLVIFKGHINPIPFIAGIFLTSSLIILSALWLSRYFTKITSFIIGTAPIDLIAVLPLPALFGIFQTPANLILPTSGGMHLISAGIGKNPDNKTIILSLLSMILWNILLLFPTRTRIRQLLDKRGKKE